MAFALLLLPFTRKLRQRATKLHHITLALTLLLCAAVLGSITGCGTDTGFFAQPQQNYTITITGTATGSNGYALQHSTTIKLTVQ